MLLLLAPFYNHYNGRGMTRMAEETEVAVIDQKAVETNSVSIELTEITKVEVDYIKGFGEEYEAQFYLK